MSGEEADGRRAQPRVAPVTVALGPGVRLHGLHTGWVSIKRAHYQLRGPPALRFPAIATDPTWMPPRPILCWLIEHPEGVMAVDTGERAAANDLNAYVAGADVGNRWFITRNFRVDVSPQEELASRLPALGYAPTDVQRVILTHLHFDHVGGLRDLPGAMVLVSRVEAEVQRRAPAGALAAQWPPGTRAELIDMPDGRPVPVTQAGDVQLLPTPGHSPGHLSVLVRGKELDVLLAGDVTFDEGQLQRRQLGGIVRDVSASRASLERVRRQVLGRPTVYLPSHDPQALVRLARLQPTRLGGAP